MKNTRRIKRMNRYKRNSNVALNLTSLMDVFTILVLYLLVNQSSVEVLNAPKEITLPESVVEAKPRETVIMMVSEEYVTVQGEPVLAIKDLLEGRTEALEPLRQALQKIKESTIGLNAEAIAKSNELTIMAHRTVPFKVLKSLMTASTGVGYTKISLAVIQVPSHQ